MNLEGALSRYLKGFGDDIAAETPARFIKAMNEMLSGYSSNPNQHLKLFPCTRSSELVIINNIPFTAVCEHHLLSFSGAIDIGYIPDKYILGLSKFPRIVDCLTKKLYTQERMTETLCQFFYDSLQAKGVIIKTSAKHSCMSCRGIEISTINCLVFSTRGKISADNRMMFNAYAR